MIIIVWYKFQHLTTKNLKKNHVHKFENKNPENNFRNKVSQPKFGNKNQEKNPSTENCLANLYTPNLA